MLMLINNICWIFGKHKYLTLFFFDGNEFKRKVNRKCGVDKNVLEDNK